MTFAQRLFLYSKPRAALRLEMSIRSTVHGLNRKFARHCLGEFAHTDDRGEISGNSAALSNPSGWFPLPWSAYVRLLSVKREEAHSFCQTEALRLGWSVRQLDRQIDSQFYERFTLSKNKAAILASAEEAQNGDSMTTEEAIKDPFVLEFLDLKDEYPRFSRQRYWRLLAPHLSAPVPARNAGPDVLKSKSNRKSS